MMSPSKTTPENQSLSPRSSFFSLPQSPLKQQIPKPPNDFFKYLFQKSKRTIIKNGRKVKQVRVRPHKAFNDSVWMDKAELIADCENDSEVWEDFSVAKLPTETETKNTSPDNNNNNNNNNNTISDDETKEKQPPKKERLGTLKVEILQMSHLKNADILTYSDPFALILFEDSTFKSDYILNTLSPIYPSSCIRAAKFEVGSVFSSLYIGVFDYDDGDVNLLDDDDPLGRVEIKLSSLRPNTQYDVVYALQHNNLKLLTGQRGFIRLRISLDFECNDRKVILSYLYRAPNLVITTNERKLFRNLVYTLNGEDTHTRMYDWRVLMSYVSELKALRRLLRLPLIRFCKDTVFWKKPVRSFIVCVSFQYLCINPGYIPSFFWICILFILGDQCLTQTSRRPALHRVTSLSDILLTLLFGCGGACGLNSIDAPKEESNEYLQYEQELEEKMERDEEEMCSPKRNKTKQKDQDSEDTGKSTKKKLTDTKKILSLKHLQKLNPLSIFLYPVQKILAKVCTQIRIVQGVFSWKDPFVSFWAMLVVFGIWIVATIFPYRFAFYWGARVLGLGLFGPWNYFVGISYEKKIEEKGRLNTLKRSSSTREDKENGHCAVCSQNFSLFHFKIRHHCHNCGDIVCSNCSKNKMHIKHEITVENVKKRRVCVFCYEGRKPHANASGIQDEASSPEIETSPPTPPKSHEQDHEHSHSLLGTIKRGTLKSAHDFGDVTAKHTHGFLRAFGKGIIHFGKRWKFTLEVPIERRLGKKFVLRPDVEKSFATRIVE